MSSKPRPRVGVFMPAYNVGPLIEKTLDRLSKPAIDRVEEIFVVDNHSTDDTYELALRYKATRGLDKLQVIRNPRNLGYGGTSKVGFRYAIERGYDAVVVLHGDGQYAPELMLDLLGAFEQDGADLLFGSRMAKGCRPLDGGMPLYKFIGNRVVSSIENAVVGVNLSEWHSGYRLYSCHALRQVPFERCPDDFYFDTQIILLFKDRGLRIVERPIPTFYGTEKSNVWGFSYSYHCVRSVIEYRLHRLGVIRRDLYR